MAAREPGLITQDIYSFQVLLPGSGAVSITGDLEEISVAIAQPLQQGATSSSSDSMSDGSSRRALRVTFLDTPGHEEFEDMRANGGTVIWLSCLSDRC